MFLLGYAQVFVLCRGVSAEVLTQGNNRLNTGTTGLRAVKICQNSKPTRMSLKCASHVCVGDICTSPRTQLPRAIGIRRCTKEKG
jgi:hypothetical protein